MTDSLRPHEDRRRHQRTLARRKRRARKRRHARIRKIRLWRTLRSVRFWTRALIFSVFLLAIVFWAKFAVVYNVPSYADRNNLTGVETYVIVKSWWFGPPVFNLGGYVPQIISDTESPIDSYNLMLYKLGRYQDIVVDPHFFWVAH